MRNPSLALNPAWTQAAKRGLQFLRERQLPDGEFQTEFRAARETAPDGTVHDRLVFDSSPFVTALVLHSIAHAGDLDPGVAAMTQRGLDFLASEMDPGGLWRYWARKNPMRPLIPPDLDDTACAAQLLRLHKRPLPDNHWLFCESHDPHGAFYTWLYRPNTLRKLWLWLRTGGKAFSYQEKIWQWTGKDDVCAVVNANVLFYLGETAGTARAAAHLVEVLHNTQEQKAIVFYNDRMSLYYMASRAFASGVTLLAAAREPLLQRVAEARQPDGSYGDDLVTAMAICTLFNLDAASPDLDVTLNGLLRTPAPGRLMAPRAHVRRPSRPRHLRLRGAHHGALRGSPGTRNRTRHIRTYRRTRLMCVLITGGAGYVGRHLARHLRASGRSVVLLDNLSTGRRDPNPPAGRRRHWRPRSAPQPSARPRYYQRGASGRPRPRRRIHARPWPLLPQQCWRHTNRLGGLSRRRGKELRLRFKLLRLRQRRFRGRLGIRQAAPRQSLWRLQALLRSDAALVRPTPMAFAGPALRYFNVAGAEDDLGDDISQSLRIIPRAIHAAVGGGPPLHIFGADFATPDGTAQRDFVHVSDVTRANLQALAFVEQGGSGAIVNIGAGRGISVLQIMDAVHRLTGQRVPVVREPARPGDPASAIADCTRALQILGWRACDSDVDTIVASMLRSRSLQLAATASLTQRISATHAV